MDISDVHKLFGHLELRFMKGTATGMFNYSHSPYGSESIGIDVRFSDKDGSVAFASMTLDTIIRHHHLHKLTIYNYKNKRIEIDLEAEHGDF